MNNQVVSIVLPVYNQADHIAGVVRGYAEALANVHYTHEYLLVVNASRDNSLAVCQQLAEQYPNVRVVHSDLGGWGRAVRLGLSEARGDLLCYTNSASTSPADLTLLTLYAIANPGTIIKAHRRSRESFKRKGGSFLYNLECRALFDLPTWDINATPKVFSRQVYEQLRLTQDGDLIDLEFYIQCKQLSIPILEVPIYSKSRFSGKSTTNYRSALNMYGQALRLWLALRNGKGQE